jgi:hypothetical protein
MKIFIIMLKDNTVFEPLYYTDEHAASKRVEGLKKLTGKEFYYKKLTPI